ncbi:enoyl-CoA hydratase [Vibrio ponticus]|nr:enoyl-CoA hydratase [Vibrio ponticus]
MIYQANTLHVKEVHDGIAELCFSSPNSVNKLDLATLESLDAALDALKQTTNIRGLMLTSDKDAFIVGADITEFLGLFAKTDQELDQWLQFANQIFSKLEDLPFPTYQY